MNKQEIRDLVKEKRNNSNIENLEKWNSFIKKNLESLTEYQDSETIFFYVSFGREVDTLNLIKDSLKQGKKVVIPYYNGEIYSLSYIENFDSLILGRYAILEPKQEHIREASLDSIDLMIIPGLGFDKKMNRIGYGEGNYDRFMKKSNARKVALAYEFQLFEEIPHDEHDVPVNMIITEKNIYRG